MTDKQSSLKFRRRILENHPNGNHENLEKASVFMASMRGRYIISQALHYGIKALKEVQPDVMQEKSNIADMEYLRDTVFDFPTFLFEEKIRVLEKEVVVAPTEG